MSGPLAGIRVLEIVGIGPAPFAAMMLADMGAEVLRVDRVERVRQSSSQSSSNLLARGRRSVAIDLKHPEGSEALLSLVERADGLLEGFRPGVAERLRIGPEECLGRNPRLIYGRMTGWGQEGPYANAAGHDLNYIAVAGVLHHIGRAGEPPVPPLNLVGDFGGGGMLLAFGMVCGLLESASSGRGQVVDAAMVDGAATLMTCFHGLRHGGLWQDDRGTNAFDTGSHFYDVYETADSRFISVAAVEPQFYDELLRVTGLAEEEDLPHQMDRSSWPGMKQRFATIFRSKTLEEWSVVVAGTDACCAPVLSMAEAPADRHNRHRRTFVEVDGVIQPAPAPRFSRTPGAIAGPPASAGQHTVEALTEWGLPPEYVATLKRVGAIT